MSKAVLNSIKQEIKTLRDYEDILVTDHMGNILLSDISNIALFDLKYEEILEKNVVDLYSNLDEKNSTIFKVLRSGEAIINHEQELITTKGNRVFQIGSTFPIFSDSTIVGAIEFSRFLYSVETIKELEHYSVHKGYRQNHTIYCLEDFLTQNPEMLRIKRNLQKISKTGSTVLLNGETGTGKEILAQSIHNLSDRFDKPFISQNCAAIPFTLLESILFGTVKGSYTGATDNPGLLELATGGTLFLDEINSMPLESQIKLLKVIEEKRVRRVGGNKSIDIDVRILVAVNEDPLSCIEAGRLREDLYYRISIVQIDVPPLRERIEDIPLLFNYFIKFYNEKMARNIKGATQEVLSHLMKYKWPGNVREIRNVVEGLFNFTEGKTITEHDLPFRYIAHESMKSVTGKKTKLKVLLDKYERELLISFMEKNRGNYSEAGKELGLSKQNMYNKLNKHGLRSSK
jgi:arginine utilization regulatory protein